MSQDAQSWLEDALPRHGRLTPAVVGLLQNILSRSAIEYLSIAGRTKDLASAEEKIKRKKYTHPSIQLTDLSGVRVITFLETQVKAISDLIRTTFDVDEKNSLDRASDLGDDRMGYRSTHFVCSLGQSRRGLLEYEALSDLTFEIQVRTVLQHAWAELAHDRSFKLGTGLPAKIQRKLNLYSGMLEIVDGAFDEIAREVDAYKSEIASKTASQLSDTELNSLTLRPYLERLAEEHDLKISFTEIPDDILSEFKAFGLNKIADLKRIADKALLEEIGEHITGDENAIGFIRTLMMYHDIDRYFTVWKGWTGLDQPTASLLAKRYGRKKFRDLMNKNEIWIEGEDDPDFPRDNLDEDAPFG
ncbi:GTP pyrophosphokinase [Bradyrhizobium cenepequi]|uniref:GTP pyrophosphokinase n=1 Tax=Bradyrhizobium cenepequi TaxID=2821403 RepID=UPI001CE34BD0|nr:RelA/SpoT domain-containing protein [Bradyrhizobium cenepequi]MCA6107281.1 RelA/SpoT domain-containing protein [Bradyrhizobium cenepequi]